MRTKHQNVMRGYGWGEVVTLYMGSNEVTAMDEVILMTPKTDKQYEAIASQLIAIGWGLA
jgi:hypothetical protein